MTKKILIDSGDLESRVAILEDGRLAELHIEREPNVVGNIYKGKVVNILPGMDAAFADIGLEKNAFLSVDDIIPQGEEEMAAEDEGEERKPQRPATISKLLKVGQEVMVQVVRAAVDTKGARVTTRLALPGRYLVLLMGEGHYVGVSRKIEQDKERTRLREMAQSIRPSDHSLIVRTEAEGRTLKDLKLDLDFLLELARRVEEKARMVNAPALVHQDLSLILRVIRDAFTREVEELLVNSPAAYESVHELVKLVAPHLANRVKLHQGEMPLFWAYQIEPEIDKLLRRRVWLSTGGYIAIDQTEALISIDVNTGRYTGRSGLAETILHTNLQAAEEVARQLRLRDLGGIIVIDFIDMDKAAHRTQVMQAFQQALKRDRMRTKILHLSPLGLVEMTRKRSGESLLQLLSEPCSCCSGTGTLLSPETIALKVERELDRLAAESRPELLLVRAHPRVASLLVGYEGERAQVIEDRLRRPLYIRANAKLHQEEYQALPLTAAELAAEITMFSPGQQVETVLVEPDPVLPNRAICLADGYQVSVTAVKALTEERATVLLEKTGHSYGEGRLVGQEPSSPPAPRRRPRRRRRSRASQASHVETPSSPEAGPP